MSMMQLRIAIVHLLVAALNLRVTLMDADCVVRKAIFLDFIIGTAIFNDLTAIFNDLVAIFNDLTAIFHHLRLPLTI